MSEVRWRIMLPGLQTYWIDSNGSKSIDPTTALRFSTLEAAKNYARSASGKIHTYCIIQQIRMAWVYTSNDFTFTRCIECGCYGGCNDE